MQYAHNSDVLSRLLARTTTAPNGCIEWQGALSGDGYGRVSLNGKTVGVHRAVYEATHGPVDPALHVDHLCRNRKCCNVDHLEPVPPSVNVRRGLAALGMLAKPKPEKVRKAPAVPSWPIITGPIKVCKAGHTIEGPNAMVNGTLASGAPRIRCRTCHHESIYAKRRAKS